MNCTDQIEAKNPDKLREFSSIQSNRARAGVYAKTKLGWLAAGAVALGCLLSFGTYAQSNSDPGTYIKLCSKYNVASGNTSSLWTSGGNIVNSEQPLDCGGKNFEIINDKGDVSIYGFNDGTMSIRANNGLSITGNTSFNGYRLSNIADATEDGDAINLGQLKKIGLVNDAAEFLTPVLYDDSNPGRITFRGDGFGVALANVAPGLISSDSMEAINGSQFFALQNRVQVLEVQIGNGGGGGGGGNDDHHGSGSDSLDIGSGNDTAGANAIGYGNDNQVGGDRATGIGNANTVTARNGIAMGNDNKVTGANGIGIGNGNGTQVNGNDSVAIGHGARASATNSVALGSGSVADRSNTVSVGAVGNERQIANVAAGSLRTDAANWGQVQDAVGQVRGAMNGLRDWANRRFDKLDRRIDGMGAVSAANAQMAINAGGVQPGKGRFAVGMGFAGGEGALAVGYAKAITERLRLSVGGSTGSAQTTAGIGIGIDL